MKKNNYLEGIYRRNAKGFGFVKVENMEDEIYISKDKSKNALNEDKVLIEIIEEKSENKKAEGRIVEILGRQKDTIVGIFQKSKNFGFVVPDNKNFGTDIFISKKDCGKARNNHKVLVKITKYPKKGKNAEGKIIEILGGVNEAGVDMLSLIKEYDLPYVFPKAVVNEAKSKGNKINEKDIKNRKDLRNDIVFTIDGQDAKDLDDAVSVKKLENGNYKLDVHIADVSHYVKKNSAIDKEAFLRSTSIYLADRVVPMLPFELSNGICSLNPNVDRCTLTCKMHIDTAGKCTSYTIVPSLIHSDQRCTYAKVNALLENDPSVLAEYDNVKDLLLRLEKCARSLQERSMERGCIDFNSKEAKIILNKNGKPVDVQLKSRGFAEQMIEECMILANVCVANYLHSHSLPCMYRVHEDPDPKKVYSLCSIADILHEEINFDPEHIQAKDIQLLLEQVKDPANKEILSIVALRTMQKARYDEKCIGHYGLALSEYCHFTSPIRRYSDLIVHRMLRKYCFEECKKDPRYDMEIIQEQSLHVSSKERDAIAIERKVDDYEKALYMSSRIGKRFKGTIVGVQSFGFFVELENTIEGLVPIRSLYDDFYEFDEDTMSLQAQMTGNRYQIGQSVNVVCMETDINKGQITFALC